MLSAEGETVDVGTLICYIEAEAKPASRHDSSTLANRLNNDSFSSKTMKRKSRYSPAVLKLAAENEIDLTNCRGLVMGGRITRKDVLTYHGKGK